MDKIGREGRYFEKSFRAKEWKTWVWLEEVKSGGFLRTRDGDSRGCGTPISPLKAL